MSPGEKGRKWKGIVYLPGSTVRQLYRPVKRMNPGRLNLWQIDGGMNVGGMSSQERKQRRRFPLILLILLTICFPSQNLLDFPTSRAKSARQCGKPGAGLHCLCGYLPDQSAPSTGLPQWAHPRQLERPSLVPLTHLMLGCPPFLSCHLSQSHFSSTAARTPLQLRGIYNVAGA